MRRSGLHGQRSDGRIFRDVERLTSFTEDIVAAGKVAGSRTVSCRLSKNRTACALLGEPVVLELLRVRTADGEPICLERTFLASRTRTFIDRDALDGGASLYDLLEAHGESIVRSDELLTSRLATSRECALLETKAPLVVVAISRVCYDRDGGAVELTENVLCASRYVFRFQLRRTRPAC